MNKTGSKSVLALILALSLLLAVATLAACGSGSNSGDNGAGDNPGAAAPFKVGVAGPMTGQYAPYGTSHKAGAELAVEELNAAGGVNGAEVSISLGDDLGDPKEAVLVAQKFIDDSDVVVVDGHQFSGATIAAGAKYEAAGLPMITPSATNPDIAGLGGFVWRICMTDAAQGKGLADYSVNTLGKKKWAALVRSCSSSPATILRAPRSPSRRGRSASTCRCSAPTATPRTSFPRSAALP